MKIPEIGRVIVIFLTCFCFLIQGKGAKDEEDYNQISMDIQKAMKDGNFSLERSDLGLVIIKLENNLISKFINENEQVKKKKLFQEYQKYFKFNLIALLNDEETKSEEEKKFFDYWAEDLVYQFFFYQDKLVFVPLRLQEIEEKKENLVELKYQININLSRFPAFFSEMMKELKEEELRWQLINHNYIYFLNLDNKEINKKTESLVDPLLRKNGEKEETYKDLILKFNNTKKLIKEFNKRYLTIEINKLEYQIQLLYQPITREKEVFNFYFMFLDQILKK